MERTPCVRASRRRYSTARGRRKADARRSRQSLDTCSAFGHAAQHDCGQRFPGAPRRSGALGDDGERRQPCGTTRAGERHRPARARRWATPQAPLMLFLHGFPEYSGAWDEVLPAFAGLPCGGARPARLCALLQARGPRGLPHQAPGARHPGARRPLLAGPAVRAGGARLGRLRRLCHGHCRAQPHREAGGDQRRAPGTLPARADRGRGAARGQRLHPLPARPARPRSACPPTISRSCWAC